MMNTNLTIGKNFKNYKMLCAYLSEPVKTGKSKLLQIKEWKRHFDFVKEGQKIIITDVYETPLDKIDNRTSNNDKNVKYMAEYMAAYLSPRYLDGYYSISYWSTHILKILNKDICELPYNSNETVLQFCNIHNIHNPDLFYDYVSAIKSVTKNLITTAFRVLSKKNKLDYTQGYVFYYEDLGRNKLIGTHRLNEFIDSMEKDICEDIQLNHFPNSNIIGKQMIYVLQKCAKSPLL